MKAWQLIEKPENWTRSAVARDAKRFPCRAKFEGATCWCALGALIKAEVPDEGVARLHDKLGEFSVPVWNDTHTHAEVLAVLKELDI